MKNMIYPLTTLCLLFPFMVMAQTSDRKITKKTEVTIENGEKTVIVETEENGNSTKEIYKGQAAEEYLQNNTGFYGNGSHGNAVFKMDIPNDSLLHSYNLNGGYFDFSRPGLDSMMKAFHFEWNENLSEEIQKLAEELKNIPFHFDPFQFNDSVFNFNNQNYQMKIIILDDDEINENTKEKLKKSGMDIDTEQKDGRRVQSKVVVARMVLIEDMEPEKKSHLLEDVAIGFYPSPGNGDFTLEFTIEEEKEEAIITIHDLTGKIIYTETVKGKGIYKKQISLTEPSGVYILKIQQGKKAITKKLIIN